MMRAWVMLLVLGAAFLTGALWMFGVQFEAGSGYPEYSSFRRDAAGTRILYESLASLPSLTVERNQQPLEWLRAQQATVLVLGARRPSSEQIKQFAEPLENLARAGNRVVVAFHEGKDDEDDSEPPAAGKPRAAPPKRAATDAIDARWHLSPGGVDPVEMQFAGKATSGTILVVPDATVFRNAAFASEWSPRVISGYLGNHRRVVFDESHLGLMESGSVVGLARRYRLQGFVLGAAIVVLLFVWRSTSPFPHPEPQAAKGIAGRASAAGLAALLGQNVMPQQLVAAAWSAWLKGKPSVPAARRREAEALMQNATAADPLGTLAKVHATLSTSRRPSHP